MFCAAGQRVDGRAREWIEAGAIGPVREVHNWSSRPFWPQGMTTLPAETAPVPDGLDWDLWLGPVPHRPYSPAYTNAVFRGWYDFGTGALGDMGHYSFFQIFKILKLGSPLTVEASRSQYWKIDDLLWKKQTNSVSYPQASLVRWEFPERAGMPPVTLHWYDGGLRPPKPRELEEDGEAMPEEGLLFVGDRREDPGRLHRRNPRLIPKAKMQAFQPPPQTLPRPAEELEQWVRACRGTAPSDASFENVAAITETILLGTIAVRVEKKLRWDAANGALRRRPRGRRAHDPARVPGGLEAPAGMKALAIVGLAGLLLASPATRGRADVGPHRLARERPARRLRPLPPRQRRRPREGGGVRRRGPGPPAERRRRAVPRVHPGPELRVL